jgi:UDP:flavonoid glycosyltransferase YjiC (YdhE family)
LSQVRPNVHYIGPLPFRLNAEIPEKIIEIPRDKPIVYFAMGSSGKPKLISRIIEGFRDKPYRVIAPVEAHIKDIDLDIPPNVYVTGFVPAHKVNPMGPIYLLSTVDKILS